MNYELISLIIIFLTGYCSLSITGQTDPARQWTCFRGYMSSDVLDNANLPESFGLNEMINIRWKNQIPGLVLSSPEMKQVINMLNGVCLGEDHICIHCCCTEITSIMSTGTEMLFVSIRPAAKR